MNLEPGTGRQERSARRARQHELLADLALHALKGDDDLPGLARRAVRCLGEGIPARWCAVLSADHEPVVEQGERPPDAVAAAHAAVPVDATPGEDRVVRAVEGWGKVAVQGTTTPLDADDLRFVDTLAELLSAAARSRAQEHASRKTAARLEQALRASRAGAWESDLKRQRTFWSPEFRELLRLTDEDEPGAQLWYDLVHPGDRERAQQAAEVAMADGSDLDLEVRIVRRDGQQRWVRSLGKMVVDDLGRPDSIHGIVIDVTERKRADLARDEARRRSSAAMRMESLGRLAGGVAHDFNNLLTVVIGGVDQVLLDLEDDPARSLLERVREAGLRGSALCRQLLALGRPCPEDIEVVDVGARIQELEPMLRRVLGERVELVVELPTTSLHVRIAPGDLDQVLVNLCMNARDAMPDGGRLDVVASGRRLETAEDEVRPGRWVVLAVRDEGEGMTEEQAAQAFEPFYTTKAAGQGTGLGLASVYGIVKGRGGRVLVTTSLGRGTTFEAWLPRCDALPAQPPSPDPEEPRASRPATILVVEDEPALRDLLAQYLEREGHRVLQATDGEDALRVAGSCLHEVDLLLTDVVMPRLDGPGLVRRLRTARPDLRVLYVTGYAGDAHRHGLLEGERVLAKPFTRRDILAAVAASLLEG